MKKIIILITSMIMFSLFTSAQYKKNGDPDMRYSANKRYSSSVYNTRTNNQIDYQSGYIKSNGTYVSPSFHKRRNRTNTDNFSTEPNTNDLTGKQGYRARDYSPEAYNYGAERVIHRGFFGGQYYINDMGKKIYVPKRY